MTHSILSAIVCTFALVGAAVVLSVIIAMVTGGRFVIAINDNEEKGCTLSSEGLSQIVERKK